MDETRVRVPVSEWRFHLQPCSGPAISIPDATRQPGPARLHAAAAAGAAAAGSIS